MSLPRISLNNLSYQLPNTAVSFKQLHLSFSANRYGIVGINGVGKTTLFKLILGELQPDQGVIQIDGAIAYVPQLTTVLEQGYSIAQALGVDKILIALEAIAAGSCKEQDFNLADGNWDLQARIEQVLNSFSLWPLDLMRPFSRLSGGQQTKILLAKTLIFPADFLLLDEPSNNLDCQARKVLLHYLQQTQQGVLLTSHDRELLNAMDNILELTEKGLQLYGGAYDFYREEKQRQQRALQQALQNRSEELNKARQLVQTRMERHQQNEAKGRKGKWAQIKAVGSYDKMGFKTKQGQSERTNRRIRIQAKRKLTEVDQSLQEVRQQLEFHEQMDFPIPEINVASNKVVLSIKDVSFRYNPAAPWLFKNFNFEIIGPQRIAITGPNGCGKSTLIKLILGELSAQQGSINLGVEQVVYLDQPLGLLDPKLSLIENYRLKNPDATLFDAHQALAMFKFRNQAAKKQVSALSGGECIRAGLAICLMTQQPPQLIILDEPTNHLDLESIEIIEQALCAYQGALLVVSHDSTFLEQLKIETEVRLA